jgi:hypothetical protein
MFESIEPYFSYRTTVVINMIGHSLILIIYLLIIIIVMLFKIKKYNTVILSAFTTLGIKNENNPLLQSSDQIVCNSGSYAAPAAKPLISYTLAATQPEQGGGFAAAATQQQGGGNGRDGGEVSFDQEIPGLSNFSNGSSTYPANASQQSEQVEPLTHLKDYRALVGLKPEDSQAKVLKKKPLTLLRKLFGTDNNIDKFKCAESTRKRQEYYRLGLVEHKLERKSMVETAIDFGPYGSQSTMILDAIIRLQRYQAEHPEKFPQNFNNFSQNINNHTDTYQYRSDLVLYDKRVLFEMQLEQIKRNKKRLDILNFPNPSEQEKVAAIQSA